MYFHLLLWNYFPADVNTRKWIIIIIIIIIIVIIIIITTFYGQWKCCKDMNTIVGVDYFSLIKV